MRPNPIAVARKVLAAQAANGVDPRASTESGRKRNAGIAEAHRRNREWKRKSKEDGRDQAWFLREIVPKLNGFSLSENRQGDGFVARSLLAPSCR